MIGAKMYPSPESSGNLEPVLCLMNGVCYCRTVQSKNSVPKIMLMKFLSILINKVVIYFLLSARFCIHYSLKI